ncbi:MAG: arginine repressor [Clostridia bacterium]|nr:arginine repressor [Clostridia bacterium]
MQKKARQEKILELINQKNIETQEDLITGLREMGYAVTQATVSRDIRELNLIKGTTGSGAYRYVQTVKTDAAKLKFNGVLTESVLRMDYAGNMIVIKTIPGLASPVAACIDTLREPEILGCIAGDDTVFVAIRSYEQAKTVCETLKTSIREL